MKKQYNDVLDIADKPEAMDVVKSRVSETMLERVSNGTGKSDRTDISPPEAERATSRRAIVTTASSVPVKLLRWLWPERIPYGCLTLVDGDPGIGKSTLTLDIAARVSRGEDLFGGGTVEEPSDVILLSSEDPADTVIVPRLIAAGADLNRAHILQGVSDGDREGMVSLQADIDLIEEEIQRRNVRLVVIDPINAYLGRGIDSHRDSDIRGVLSPLSKLAEKTGAAIVALRHLTKAKNGKAIYAGLGSIGYTGAARSVLTVARDPDDPEGGRVIVAVAKSNMGICPPSLAYHVGSYNHPDPETPFTAGRVVWEGESSHTADDLCRDTSSDEPKTAREEAKDFLRDLLKDGRIEAKEVLRKAMTEGIAKKTLQRAKKELGIRSTHDRKPGESGPTYWEFPDTGNTLNVSLCVDGHPTPVDGQENMWPSTGEPDHLHNGSATYNGEDRTTPAVRSPDKNGAHDLPEQVRVQP